MSVGYCDEPVSCTDLVQPLSLDLYLTGSTFLGTRCHNWDLVSRPSSPVEVALTRYGTTCRRWESRKNMSRGGKGFRTERTRR